MGYKRITRGNTLIGKGSFTIIAQAVITYDPPSLTSNTGVTSADQIVPGATPGDFVWVAPPYDLQGVTLTAWVRAPNAIVFRLQNGTGGPVDLPSGTWRVKIVR
ncbi:MAG TPA: hypothetical protein VKJ47_13530 [Candidatus Binatia bacterium]|nr:hypothetical protein [Candidatus Binatia bacterium]